MNESTLFDVQSVHFRRASQTFAAQLSNIKVPDWHELCYNKLLIKLPRYLE